MGLIQKTFVTSAILFVLAGCGGSGGGSGPITNDPYVGRYQGEFYQGKDNTVGTISFSVTSSGALSGTTTQYSNGLAWDTTITGTVQPNGTVSLTNGTGPASTGSLTAPTASTVQAGLSDGTNNLWLVLVVNPQAPPTGANAFAGDFSGWISNTTTGYTGVDAWTVSSTGALSGSALVNDNGVATLATLSGTVSSAGAVSYKVMVGTSTYTTVTGTLTLQSGLLTGTLTNSAGNALSLVATTDAPSAQ